MQVRAKKFLGQHFLTDKNIAHKIVKALQTKEGIVLNVLEVGPGMGVLTDFMVTDQAISLSVIDIDRESISFIEKKIGALPYGLKLATHFMGAPFLITYVSCVIINTCVHLQRVCLFWFLYLN